MLAGPISTPCTRADTMPEVEFYAFDILVSDGEDLRGLPLSMRKASLSQSSSKARSARTRSGSPV